MSQLARWIGLRWELPCCAGLVLVILAAWPAFPQQLPASQPVTGSATTAPASTEAAATEPAATQPAPLPLEMASDLAAVRQLAGKTVESVRIEGNTQVSTADIRRLVRTREGEPFDPETAIDDYHRIYDRMRTFANVEAKVFQPTPGSVIVVFTVTEQTRIHDIRYEGNQHIDTADLEKATDLLKGEAIDSFRINQARQSIEKLYHTKNFPFAHVQIDQDALVKNGDVVFQIVEGPEVTIRRIDFIGNDSFTPATLRKQINSDYYLFILRPGTFDPETVDADVAALRQFYQGKGFFDAKVGRKLTFSTDQKEMELTFVIDEGARYVIDHVEFHGNKAVSDATLRQNMQLLEGKPYDEDAIAQDTRSIVRAYSKAGGYVYVQTPGQAPSPDYLNINTSKVYSSTPGHVTLVYDINEGKQYTVGRILIKGNTRTKDNVVERELRIQPSQEYDSAEVLDAVDRLRGTPYFDPHGVTITPVPNGDPDSRDLLVEVKEQPTAKISAGVGINSNGGLGGQLSYDQSNFDLTNMPGSWADLFSNTAFAGAGQDFRVSFDPGTQGTDAVVTFTEPYLLDQPYSLSTSAYLSDRIRENYDDDRAGGQVSFGKRFNYVYSAQITLLGEDVDIKHINNEEDRAPEIDAGAGHHTLTSAGITFRRDTTNHGPVVYKGNNAAITFSDAGALGGTVYYSRVAGNISDYQSLNEDLLGRYTVLNSHVESGYDLSNAPFYERFYGGGIGSIRGSDFRGVGPRAGPLDDPVGGNFFLTGGEELDFPIAEDFLRGDVFVDVGDVESEAKLGIIRSAVGVGVRINVPFLGNAPIAIDFAVPITQSRQDNTQVVSFSLAYIQ